MEGKADKQQIRSIYAMASKLGILERGNHEDMLHQLVESVVGKDSVSSLSTEEAKAVIEELRLRMPTLTSTRYTESPGYMTEGQQKKVWALLYSLKSLDSEQSRVSLGKRLTGIIKKEFGISAAESAPMKWITEGMGNTLIETIKGYIKTAKRKGGES